MVGCSAYQFTKIWIDQSDLGSDFSLVNLLSQLTTFTFAQIQSHSTSQPSILCLFAVSTCCCTVYFCLRPQSAVCLVCFIWSVQVQRAHQLMYHCWTLWISTALPSLTQQGKSIAPFSVFHSTMQLVCQLLSLNKATHLLLTLKRMLFNFLLLYPYSANAYFTCLPHCHNQEYNESGHKIW